jgi:hypothetical protein
MASTALEGNVLYMPSHPDDPSFRSEVSSFTGDACDYLDPRYQVPTMDQLRHYDMVFTWVNYAYADRDATGDLLADYVDAGGIVLLGQWCLPTAGNYLGGRIMDQNGRYLPVTGNDYGSGTYSGDGSSWLFRDVSSYSTPYRDNVTVRPGSRSDGTYTDGWPFAAWNRDPGFVVYAAGLLGTYGDGDGACIVANIVDIPEPGTFALLALGGVAVPRRR